MYSHSTRRAFIYTLLLSLLLLFFLFLHLVVCKSKWHHLEQPKHVKSTKLFSNPKSENELDSELKIDMEQMKIYNDSDSDMEVLDDENSISFCSSCRSARSWQKTNFGLTLFQFQSNSYEITGNLNEDASLDFFKLFFDQNLVQIIVNETNKFQANTTIRAKQRTESRYESAECNVGLCVTDCFQDYHILKYF